MIPMSRYHHHTFRDNLPLFIDVSTVSFPFQVKAQVRRETYNPRLKVTAVELLLVTKKLKAHLQLDFLFSK